eukprot:817698-Lingulodinium_polyedra.AAC.1
MLAASVQEPLAAPTRGKQSADVGQQCLEPHEVLQLVFQVFRHGVDDVKHPNYVDAPREIDV